MRTNWVIPRVVVALSDIVRDMPTSAIERRDAAAAALIADGLTVKHFGYADLTAALHGETIAVVFEDGGGDRATCIEKVAEFGCGVVVSVPPSAFIMVMDEDE